MKVTYECFDTFSARYPSHSDSLASADPEAKYSPLGENTTLWTQCKCPMRILIRPPLDTFHTPIVLSEDPDAKYSPFGENATLLTTKEWLMRVLMHSPLDTLHNLIVLILRSKYSPFGENSTA